MRLELGNQQYGTKREREQTLSGVGSQDSKGKPSLTGEIVLCVTWPQVRHPGKRIQVSFVLFRFDFSVDRTVYRLFF